MCSVNTCINGHEWTELNTYTSHKTGWKYCRECNRIKTRGRRRNISKHKEVNSLKFLLSDKDLKILQLMSYGYSNKGISKAAKIELKTAENYVSEIYSKLHLPNDVDINKRVMAIREYWLSVVWWKKTIS